MPTLTSIVVTPANPAITPQQNTGIGNFNSTQKFSALGVYSDASTQDLTSLAVWVSSAPGIATVAPGGLASASGALPDGLNGGVGGLGTSNISAAFSGVIGSTVLTVTASLMPTTPNSVQGLNCLLTDPFANSYVDVAYCSAYWAAHYNQVKAATWSALPVTQQQTLLIAACRVIETARFIVVARLRDGYPLIYDRRTGRFMQLNDQIMPVKYYYYQRLQFPRNLDRDIVTGNLYIPEPVCMAQCEQAVYMLSFDDTAMANRIQGITEDITQIGNMRFRQNYVQDGSQFSPMALDLCRTYMLKTSYEVRRQ